MTIEEFKKTGFYSGIKIKYKGKVFDAVSVDFEECLIGIEENIEGADEDEISWKRCENCELIGE
jgi:hypothetical protein